MKKIKIKAKLAYAEIMDLLKKHKDICVFNIDEIQRMIDLHLYGIQLNEDYGLEINPVDISSIDWYRCKEYCSIGLWGEKHNRTISWPDIDKQPEDETLLGISFPTGPFIFSADSNVFNSEYPQEFFQKFWNELKSYNPDYIDSHNSSLYWKINNAKNIFNDFDSIMEKYRALNKEDYKRRKIRLMKEALARLEGS
jgi:hypothetical protein